MRKLIYLFAVAAVALVVALAWRARIAPVAAVDFWQPEDAPVPVLAPRPLPGGGARAAAIFDASGDERPDLFLGGYASDLLATHLPRGWSGQELAGAGATRAVLATDLNRDGAPDLLAGGDKGLRIWLNDRHGRFRTAPAPAGSGAVGALAAADVNGDGWVDFVSADPAGEVHLWMHDGGRPGDAPVYHDGTRAAGIEPCCAVTAVLLADLDADGDADLITASHGGALKVYANDGHGKFSRVQSVPAQHGNWSTLAAADFDHDGDLDIFVGQDASPAFAWLPSSWWRWLPGPRQLLARNDGKLEFTDVAATLGLDRTAPVAGAAWLDADDDGDLELLLAGPGGLDLWRATGTGEHWRPAPVAGEPATAVAVGDVDHNGYPDLLVRGPRGEVRLELHRGGTNHWLAVRLRARGNFPLQGARVEVATRDGKRMSAQATSGSGAGTDQFDALLFGLGRRAEIQGVSVFWPSGKFTRLERNNLDRYIGFVEPSDASGGRNVWLREPLLEGLKTLKRPHRLQCP